MRQRVRVSAYPLGQNGRGAAIDISYTDIKDKNRSLENIKTNNLLNEVSMGNNNVKTNHHQRHDNPIVIESKDHYVASLSLLFKPL